MINLACTSLCETGPIVSISIKFLSVVKELMDNRTQTQDRSMAEIQNLLATGMTPLIQLADILKTQFSGNSQAKSLLGYALTIMGQVQYHMSVRRRYMIRPTLRKSITRFAISPCLFPLISLVMILLKKLSLVTH